MKRFGDLSQAEKSNKMISIAKDTAKSLRKAAEKLDKVRKDCKIAHACGITAGMLGGVLTIGGGVATVVSPGIAAPLLSIGMGFALAGAVTNLGTSTVEDSIISTEMKKAEKDLEETLDSVSNVNKTENNVQLWLDRKEKTRLLFICFLALLSMRAGGKLAGGLTTGIGAAFLLLDANDLRYTIRDLYSGEDKGSETATLLKQKANELDKIK